MKVWIIEILWTTDMHLCTMIDLYEITWSNNVKSQNQMPDSVIILMLNRSGQTIELFLRALWNCFSPVVYWQDDGLSSQRHPTFKRNSMRAQCLHDLSFFWIFTVGSEWGWQGWEALPLLFDPVHWGRCEGGSNGMKGRNRKTRGALENSKMPLKCKHISKAQSLPKHPNNSFVRFGAALNIVRSVYNSVFTSDWVRTAEAKNRVS